VVAEHLGEARLMMSLGFHPHIVRCTDCFMSDGKFCILQEYCDRGDLRQYIAVQRQQGVEAINEARIRKFLIEILMALDFIHDKSIVHRDLKPGNIFLKGRSLDIKVGDFGVCLTNV